MVYLVMGIFSLGDFASEIDLFEAFLFKETIVDFPSDFSFSSRTGCISMTPVGWESGPS